MSSSGENFPLWLHSLHSYCPMLDLSEATCIREKTNNSSVMLNYLAMTYVQLLPMESCRCQEQLITKISLQFVLDHRYKTKCDEGYRFYRMGIKFKI